MKKQNITFGLTAVMTAAIIGIIIPPAICAEYKCLNSPATAVPSNIKTYNEGYAHCTSFRMETVHSSPITYTVYCDVCDTGYTLQTTFDSDSNQCSQCHPTTSSCKQQKKCGTKTGVCITSWSGNGCTDTQKNAKYVSCENGFYWTHAQTPTQVNAATGSLLKMAECYSNDQNASGVTCTTCTTTDCGNTMCKKCSTDTNNINATSVWPATSISACYVPASIKWEFSDSTGKGTEQFQSDCHYTK